MFCIHVRTYVYGCLSTLHATTAMFIYIDIQLFETQYNTACSSSIGCITVFAKACLGVAKTRTDVKQQNQNKYIFGYNILKYFYAMETRTCVNPLHDCLIRIVAYRAVVHVIARPTLKPINLISSQKTSKRDLSIISRTLV